MGLVGGGLAGAATVLGASLVMIKHSKIGQLLNQINMDFIIGLMLSAAAFSLILPAYESAYHSQQLAWITCSLAAGMAFIKMFEKIIEHFFYQDEKKLSTKRAILFVAAMMTHNFPEGLASGATMSLPGVEGHSLLSMIVFQNIPEGFTTAMSFITLGMGPLTAFFAAAVTGLVELGGGILGGFLSHELAGVLPCLMAFAGGAMMSVVLSELFEKIKQESFSIFVRPGFFGGVTVFALFNSL